MNDIPYEATEGQEHSLAVLECLERVPMPTGVIQTTRFKWLTNFRLTAKNVLSIAQEGGRIRWKTENEGFNVQRTAAMRWNMPTAVTSRRRRRSTCYCKPRT